MTAIKQISLCAVAAAWLGCQVSVDEATEARESAVTTPGGQTAYPSDDSSSNPTGLGYYEYLPAGYSTGTRFPLVVFFHGIGERGDGTLAELPRVLKNGPPKLIEGGKDFPAIVISPQLPPSEDRWTPSITTPLVSYFMQHYKVDLDRVYITGLSLGGDGTWQYAKANPGGPAAIVPICGPKWTTGYSVLRDLPIWTFHKIGDTTVPISDTQKILQEITGVWPEVLNPNRAGQTGYFKPSSWTWRAGQAAPQAGENPTFTVYENTSGTNNIHDAWTSAYNNQAMWDWLFAQRRPSADIVFQQDFQSSTSVPSYVDPTAPDSGHFDDIGVQPNGGVLSINAGRLQLARAGSTAADNKAAVTRWTDLPGSPALLRASFDIGVSGWTLTPFQSNAMVLSFARLTGPISLDAGDIAANTFQTVSAKGKGTGQFAIVTAGVESAPLAANGTLHRVDVLLNKSGAAASYRAPDGTVRSLQNNGVALWVDGTVVVASAAASNGADSTLTDFRFRWGTGDNGTWLLDNIVMRRSFPQ